MIGLDTNVLLRLFVEDDAGQSARARRHVDAATADEPCLINSVVLAEFAWALAKRMKQIVETVGLRYHKEKKAVAIRN